MTNINLLFPLNFSTEISYTIGSGSKDTIFPFVLDFLSIQNSIIMACGPIDCIVNVSDSLGLITTTLPSFVTYSP
jgi:hypothetical protein